jgi:hypothetical protein
VFDVDDKINIGIDLFHDISGDNPFFLAICQLSKDAEKAGVKIKQLTVFYDDDGVAAQLHCVGAVDKIFELKEIIKAKGVKK